MTARRRTGLIALLSWALVGCTASPVTTVIHQAPTARPSASTADPVLNPLAIDAMRQRDDPGSDPVIEQTLAPVGNYRRFIASYRSDGLKIYGLLTVPNGPRPKSGWPVIIFNHGYIPPAQYRTTERYVAYVDAFARAGYIVFKSDYRVTAARRFIPRAPTGRRTTRSTC